MMMFFYDFPTLWLCNLFAEGRQYFTTLATTVEVKHLSNPVMSVREFRNKTSCALFQDNKQKQNTLVLCLQNCSPQMSHHLIQVPQDFTGKQSKVSYSLHIGVKLKKIHFSANH